ncbi:MAG: metallophosphatase family protein [Desulforhopalus sp.]|nr:metallophosphatase family protein [Desulforhopalus sp.]
MKQIGILSDTHISTITDDFLHQCTTAFDQCETVIHAGDLIDISILAAFRGKELHAVCGNSCNNLTKLALPKEKSIRIHGFLFGITHGSGSRQNIKDRVFDRFPTAECIIYGHTHVASLHKIGNTLLVNPGSFQGTGKFGCSGTYAILKIDSQGIHPSIHTLPPCV